MLASYEAYVKKLKDLGVAQRYADKGNYSG